MRDLRHAGGRRGTAAARIAPAPRGLALPGLRRRIALQGIGCDGVAQALALVLRGWQPGPATARGPAATTVTASRGRFRVASDYLDAPMTGLLMASAVCALLADIAQSWAEQRPGRLALHAAAVRSGAGLVVLAGPARAGKSTLATRLALEPGWSLWTDDVLPLRPDGQAVALGILPRLRLPVPAAAGAALRDLAARACVLGDDRYGYVAVPGQAPHGTTAPLRVLIRLDRRPGAAPCLHALPGPEALRLLMEQAIGGDARLLPRMMRLATDVVALRLVYDDPDSAAALLRRALASPETLAARPPAPALPPDAPDTGAEPLAPAGMALDWRRIPGPVPRRLGDGLALWSPDLGRGLALNATAAALWQMLAQPVSGDDMAAVLAAAFPAEPPERIRADVAAALGAMLAEGLLTAQAA
jgi:hypothetical protein